MCFKQVCQTVWNPYLFSKNNYCVRETDQIIYNHWFSKWRISSSLVRKLLWSFSLFIVFPRSIDNLCTKLQVIILFFSISLGTFPRKFSQFSRGLVRLLSSKAPKVNWIAQMGQQQSKGELLFQQVNYGNIEGIKSLRNEGASLEVSTIFLPIFLCI